MGNRLMFVIRGIVVSVIKGACWAFGVLIALVFFNIASDLVEKMK